MSGDFFNIGARRSAVPRKLKALAEQLAAQICASCKDSRKEILDCQGRIRHHRCGVFELRPGKARFNKVLAMTGKRK
jgi:hypothetical protein